MAIAEPVGRWVLHRAGLRNVWQYDDAQLTFAGGRLLLRGMNGAGKSKALELLLPFLLDGDTRQIDATQRDRTTVRWLMTADRDDGDHVGYVWLELRLVDADGVECFQTLGAGLKASTRTGKASVWYFLTDRRVNVDFTLDVDRELLSIDKLRAELGDDAVVESGAEHRRRVGRVLFGLHDDGRFGNLLHLLHELRDPNVGNLVEARQLPQLLSNALPPLDDRFIGDAAARLDDLEQVKAQVERAERAAATLADFLAVYRGYARRKVRDRALTARGAARDERRARRAVDKAATAHGDALAAMAAARDLLQQRGADRLAADARRRAIELSPAYRDHLALVDKERAVDALAEAFASAQRWAADASRHVDRAVEADDVAQRAAEQDAATASDRLAAAGHDLQQAGVDRALLPELPADELDDMRARIDRLLVFVAERRDRVRDVRALARQHEEHLRNLERARADEAASEEVLEAATAAHAAAEERLDAAVDAWTSAVGGRWRTVEIEAPAALDDALRQPADEVTAAVSHAVGVALQPFLVDARAAEASAAAEAQLAERARDDALDALAALHDETDARPAAPANRRAQRDPAKGAPFYELVDLGPGVDASTAANIEAGLEASGILDAWVTPDGILRDAPTGDVVLAPEDDQAPASSTLRAVLVAAPAPSSPVAPATVERILDSIGVADGVTRVGVDGQWRAGILSGEHTKADVEYLGAGARAATRARRIAAAQSAVDEAEAAHASAVQRAAAATQARERLEEVPRSLPSAVEVETALAAQRWTSSDRDHARSTHQQRVDERAGHEALSARSGAELQRQATRDGLPFTFDALDATDDALRDADGRVRELRSALAALGRSQTAAADARAALDDARARAEAARVEAAAAGARHAAADVELDALRRSIGDEPERLLAELRDINDTIERLDAQEIPAAQHAHEQAIADEATARTAAEAARAAADVASQQATEASSQLRVLIEMDGVLAAAVDDETIVDADALLAAIPAGDEVSDTLVLSRFDAMEKSLPGGFDAAMSEPDGVKLVHIADDRGRRPLTAMAAQVAEEAAATRARLQEREREVLQRFLLHELVDELRTRLADATDLVTGANAALGRISTSHGKGVQLVWQLREDAPDAAATVTRLVADDLRSDDDDEALRRALLTLIDAERERDPGVGYDEHLRAALAYRDWHEFRIYVTDTNDRTSRRLLTRKLGLSQGEQRVLSYLALFAAAAAHYDSLRRESPTAPRLLLLDDAFAKVDERTHAELLGHLAELDLDYILTSERLWGCFPNVPSLEIYEAVRDPGVPGVALVHYRWDGSERHLVGV